MTFTEVTLSLLSGFGNTFLLFLLTLVFSIPLGLSYEHKNITVNATYHLPLSSNSEYIHLDNGKDRTWNTRHQIFDLTVGYRIPFGKKRNK